MQRERTFQVEGLEGKGPETSACLEGSNSCQEPRVGQRCGRQKEQVREVVGSDTQGFRAI